MQNENLEEYAKSLEEKIEKFQKEKERVRAIIGKIGGKPTLLKKTGNIVFAVLVAFAFLLSLVAKGRTEFLMLELIILLVSVKFVYFLFLQARVIHFQFWILSTLEWRLNEIYERLDELVKKQKKN